MRRFVWLLAVVLFISGCRSTAPSAPPSPASPQPAGVTQTISAKVRLDPKLQDARTEFPVVVGTFADEQHGWMVADRTRLLATDDGGRHWAHVATFDEDVRRLEFRSETQGWAFTDKAALATTDGGHTWQTAAPDTVPAEPLTRQPAPCKPDFQASAASFVNDQTGFVLCSFFQGSGGSSKWLYGTTDGGQTWNLLTGTIYGQARSEFPPGVLVGPHDSLPAGALPTISSGGTMHFLDATHGFISFRNSGPFVGHIYATADAGRTWAPLSIPGGAFTGGFHFFTPRFGRMLVNNQQPWAWIETHDGGTTWQQVYPPVAPLLTDPATWQFRDAEHGVAVGTLLDPQAVLTTADGGRTWQGASQETEMDAAPAEHGGTWSLESLAGRAVSSSLHAGGCGWVISVGDPPSLDLSLLVTRDAAQTWTRIQLDSILPTAVHSLDCHTAWVTDGLGHLYRTQDGGHQWEQML